MKRCLLFFLLLAIASPILAQEAKEKKDPPKKRKLGFTVGKDTTYVEGPLDKDGRIDYETALNELLGKGVTPEKNANVLLFKAFGPHPDGAKIPDAFFKLMKMDPPPEQGDYLVSQQDYCKKIGTNPDKFYDLLEPVTGQAWTAQEHPLVANWLKANEKPLAIAIEASKRTHFYYPVLGGRVDGKSTGLVSAQVVGVQQCRQIGSALTARAMLRVSEKKYDEAWQDLLACHRLARLVGRGGTLIEGLVGVALETLACNADIGFLDGAKVDAKKLKQCLADLQALPPLPAMADKLNQTERYWFLETVMIIDREGVGHLEGLMVPGGGKQGMLEGVISKVVFSNIQWDQALRNGNQYYDRMYAAMNIKERDKRVKELDKIELEIRTLKGEVLMTKDIATRILSAKNIGEAKGKYIGDILICLILPGVPRVQQAADRTEQNQRNLHIAFALGAFKAEQGSYPKKLDALAPKYLAKVPNDLFNGKALTYRPAADGFLLYSVGVNGKDDGGRSSNDDPDADDLPVRLPLPRAKMD